MNKKIATLVSFAACLALPLVTLAAFNPGATPVGFSGSISSIIGLVLDFLWPIFAGFAVIMFLIAGFLFLSSQGDPAKVQAARQAVLWGIIGVVVGLLAFSIPFIVRQTIGL